MADGLCAARMGRLPEPNCARQTLPKQRLDFAVGPPAYRTGK